MTKPLSFPTSFLASLLVFIGMLNQVYSQFSPDFPEPLPPLEGKLFLHGGGSVDSAMRAKFVELAGGTEAKIVVIPTADVSDPLDDKKLDVWREHQPQTFEFLHAENREEVGNPNFASKLAEATGVWISGGKQSLLVERYLGTTVEDEIMKLMTRGGIVGGSSAGAAVASKVMLVFDDQRQGFDFLPGVIVDQHFTQRKRESRLHRAIDKYPDRVGLGIDERTALVARGRRLEVIGEGQVSIYIAASPDRPARVEQLKPGTQADLMALRRSAQLRTKLDINRKLGPPQLEHGSLLIAGGGKLPRRAIEEFVRLAGASEARIVYIPCEEAKVILEEPSMLATFRDAGAGKVEWLHTKDRTLANDAKFIEPLATATGIWFGGGRQWNFVDSYQNTQAHRLMHLVLERGGIIGGSSAGASIQGDFMPRGDPLGNTRMMAEGYEQGLGFLTGVAIDQHFSQRGRFPDMRLLKRTHPQRLGIGVDEGTYLLVQKNQARVFGAGQVAFFDRPTDSPELEAYTSLVDGESYDLERREVIKQ